MIRFNSVCFCRVKWAYNKRRERKFNKQYVTRGSRIYAKYTITRNLKRTLIWRWWEKQQLASRWVFCIQKVQRCCNSQKYVYVKSDCVDYNSISCTDVYGWQNTIGDDIHICSWPRILFNSIWYEQVIFISSRNAKCYKVDKKCNKSLSLQFVLLHFTFRL